VGNFSGAPLHLKSSRVYQVDFAIDYSSLWFFMKRPWSIALPLACGVAAFAAIAFLANRFVEPRSGLGAQRATAAVQPAPPARPMCLKSGGGFFKARIDGALQMQLDWANEGTTCDGGPRPDGKGVRVSFTRKADDGKGLLIVIGIAGASESSSGKALPANITVIDEHNDRIFGTLGEDKCTIDEMRQELIGTWRKEERAYRVSGRGFCMQPAKAVIGAVITDDAVAAEESILMSTFDFAGKAIYR
jgi:hypothetical protein